jgi:WD40 repeat protein
MNDDRIHQGAETSGKCRYLPSPNKPTVNRLEPVATFHFPLMARILFTDRNRADLDWSNGSFTWRYRNRLTFERRLTIHSYHLITMRPNGHVKFRNTSSWTVEAELIVTDSRLTAAAFAPDNRTVMIADANGVLHYWSLASKAEIETLRTLEGLRNGVSVSGLEFSPDGETLVATTMLAARPIVIWNTTDWTAETESGYNSAAFSKDGKLQALGGRNHIKLIEPVSRKQIRDIELPEMMRGELRRNNQNEPNEKEKIPCLVSVLAFSPDGNTLAAGCRYPEGTVRVVKITP